MSALPKLLEDLRNSPDDRKVIIRSVWDWDDLPVDHYREFLTTAGELRAALSGAPIPRPVVSMKVVASAGLRRRTNPVDGEIIKVEPNGTILECYDDSKVSNWIEATIGGWMSVQYLQRVG